MRRAIAVAGCGLLGLAPLTAAGPLGTGFSFQGSLSQNGSPAVGLFDLRFALFDTGSDGVQVGPTLCVNDVTVENGRFTVVLDFGSTFTDQRRFLQVAVRADAGTDCSDSAGFSALAPRQEITAAPQALFALGSQSAMQLNGQPAAFYTDAGNLVGTLPDARLTANIPRLGSGNAFAAPQTISAGGASRALTVTLNENGDAQAIRGVATGATAQVFGGVFEATTSPAGVGLQGQALALTGGTRGIWGRVNSPSGWAGYFDGRGFFSNAVGVGVLNPDSALHVRDSAPSADTRLKIDASNGFSPFLTFASNGVTRWEWFTDPASHNLKLKDGAFTRLEINPVNGGVVLGTVAAPSSHLTVTGDDLAAGTFLGGPIRAQNGVFSTVLDASGLQAVSSSGASLLRINRFGGRVGIGIASSFTAAVTLQPPDGTMPLLDVRANSGLTKFWVDAAGNVGLNTAAPTALLDVAGNARIGGSLAVIGGVSAANLAGSGAGVSNLNASQLASGTVPGARLPAPGGDVGGSYAVMAVNALQGRPLSTAAVATGQVLSWNGAAWAPATISTVMGGDVAGPADSAIVDGLQGRALSATAPTTDQTLRWTGSTWAPSNAPQAVENINIARGRVSAAGALVSGSGFTVTRTAVGTYALTFASNGIPVLTATPFAAAARMCTISVVGGSGATIRVWDAAGAPVDSDLHIVVFMGG